MGINNCVLTGFVGGDPEVFAYSGGKEGLRFSFAISEKVKEEYKTTWFKVTVFGFQVDRLKENLNKGDLVIVCGKVGSYDYTNKEGQPKTLFQLTANTVEIIKKKEGEAQPPAKQPAKQQQSTGMMVDDDIPF